jgi:outer membrane protein OmpA-like peptidoglycan-associated protein
MPGAPTPSAGQPGSPQQPFTKGGPRPGVPGPLTTPGQPGGVQNPLSKGGQPQPGAPGAVPGGPGSPAVGAVPPVSPAVGAQPAGKAAVGVPAVGKVVAPPPGPARLEDLKQARVERVVGNRRIIQEPGARTIVKQDNRTFIQRNETTIIQNNYPAARSTRLPSGVTQSVYVRPDGMRVYSEVDGSGRLVRRYGRWNDGRQITYVDNRRFYRNLAIGVGAGLVAAAAIVALAPPRHELPPQRYVVDYERASYDEIYETLSAPPVERLPRAYSLDEIRYNEPVRARMRRIDLDTITFEFGSFEITPDQYGKLERIAQAMGRTIEANPGEMYLIEGHTDAVGSEEDNLTLSDRRAEAAARVLSEYYSIPMENLVTQGYGEQHLKVQTEEPERANRRVTIRRITPLMGQAGAPGAPQ